MKRSLATIQKLSYEHLTIIRMPKIVYCQREHCFKVGVSMGSDICKSQLITNVLLGLI
jgi:hypothetical protein